MMPRGSLCVCGVVGRRITLTQKAALLAIQAWPFPYGAPGPLGDELLSRPRERGCVLHGIVDVLMAEDSPTNLQPLFEEPAVQFGDLWVCGGHGSQWIGTMRANQGIEYTSYGKSGSGSGLEVKVKVVTGG